MEKAELKQLKAAIKDEGDRIAESLNTVPEAMEKAFGEKMKALSHTVAAQGEAVRKEEAQIASLAKAVNEAQKYLKALCAESGHTLSGLNDLSKKIGSGGAAERDIVDRYGKLRKGTLMITVIALLVAVISVTCTLSWSRSPAFLGSRVYDAYLLCGRDAESAYGYFRRAYNAADAKGRKELRVKLRKFERYARKQSKQVPNEQ